MVKINLKEVGHSLRSHPLLSEMSAKFSNFQSMDSELTVNKNRYYRLSAEKLTSLVVEEVLDFAGIRGAFAAFTG